MIEQIAKVVAVDEDFVWVETGRQSACGACAMNKGCGAGLFAKAFGFTSPQLKVDRVNDVKVGDQVVLGIDEHALVRGSFAAYVMPILCMIGFATLGQGVLSGPLSLDSDFAGVLGGIAGLVIGLIWLKRHSQHISHDRRYQPSILHKATYAPSSCLKS